MTIREQHIGHNPIEAKLLGLAESEELGTLASEARSLTKKALAEANEHSELLNSYKSVVGRLYEEGSDAQAEELLEVMAELEGFCSPHARL